MDPLSISASVAGLVALADLVFRHSTKYVKSVKGARKEAEDVSREVKALSLILHNLSLIAFELEETQPFDEAQQASTLKPHHLHDCRQLLRRLENGLVDMQSSLDSKSRIERLQSRLTWPFSSSDTKEILRDVQQHNQTIKLALEADSLNKLKFLLSRQSETNCRTIQVQETVNKIYDNQTSIRRDENIEKVLEFFTQANPRSEFDTNINLRHNLTGIWLTEGSEFEEWYITPGSKVWCSGIPGAGKSVLAAAIIDECLQRNADNPRKALAYFFCTYRDEKSQEPTSILSSLCSQLARQNENALEILKEYHDELTSERQLQAEASTKNLIKILRKMCSSFDRVYLIVDGLDECGHRVQESVKCLVDLLPSPDDEALSLALLSRDEFPIREILGGQFRSIEIAAHTEDIQLYVASEMEQRIASRRLRLRDLSLKDMIMARLVDGAKGMFRWVACQLDHLCELPTDRARRKALDKLPPTLFATYERILTRINDSHEQARQLVQRTLLLIGSPHHAHLSLRQICEAISLQDDEDELLDEDIVDEEEVLLRCGSLIRTRRMSEWCDELGIEFSHFSVQEYLQDECLKHPTLSAYGVSRQKACSLLASLCLDYLTLKSHEQLAKAIYDAADEAIDGATYKAFDAMNERDQQHPFYRHAATLWPFYVREAGESCCIERIHDLFQLPKTPRFSLWATTIAAHSMSMYLEDWQGDARQWFDTPSFRDIMFSNPFYVLRPDFTPLHMAAVLGMPDLCDHLLKQGANMNVRGKFGTPLHCAITGLGIFPFWSDDRQFYSANFFNKVGQLLGRRQPCQVLLKAEVNPHLHFIYGQEETYSSLSLAAMSLCDEYGVEIVVELVKAGITIGKEDLVHFQKRYSTILDLLESSKYGERQAVVGLLGILSPPDQETKGTPRSRLYTETYNWAVSMGIKDLDQLSATQPTAGLSDDEIIDLISAWIRNNDGLELGRFLEGSRSELVKSTKVGTCFGMNNGSSLHLAAKYNSLDVLKILLEHGLDANMADETGKTPAHLCHDYRVDQLRVLLEHGASTLVPDKTLETVWHTAAKNGEIAILELLFELDVRQEALKMVSSRNETPICSALNNRRTDAVQLLLKHCGSRAFWKSGKSIFRAAAEMGEPDIIQHLLDVNIEVDGMDDITGSPLHHLSAYTPSECIQILKEFFPLDQRRKQDFRMPLESLLLRAVNNGVSLDRERLEIMLPDAFISNSKEASSLWSFLGFEVTRSAMSSRFFNPWPCFKEVVLAVITLGIMAKYEEERRESASLPFMSAVTSEATSMYKRVSQGSRQPQRHLRWDSISDMMQHVMGQSRHWDSAVGKPDATRLLSLAILHDDVEMVSLLIDKGVDMHSRLDDDELSPFEFACFPNVPISERGFALLLKHANPEKISQGNEWHLGCGSLHFCAGWNGEGEVEDCDWKLKQMLRAGVDPNLPLPVDDQSPLAYHIFKDYIATAKILLDAGADPWARGSHPFDAALEAVRSGHLSILKKIAELDHESLCWDRTWVGIDDQQGFSGGNALHLAAMNGNTECLEFYLDQGLLSDLECCDDYLETPMHYAARFDHFSTIEWLKARGGNINARNRNGLIPLHLAVEQGHLETAKTLIDLGAEQQPCNGGGTPLMYAYARGNETMIEALQSSSEELQELNALNKSPRTLKILAEAMLNAILRRDVPACKRILALGCPVDVELYDEVPVTPLAVAICHQQDPKVVQLLVDAGATVSTIFPQPYQDRYLTALEAAVAQPRFNSLLHKLLGKFLEEGGNFLDMDRSPLHLAVGYNNAKGLKILLGWLRNTYGSSELNLNKPSRVVEKKSSRNETLSAFVDQKDAQRRQTALHVAASKNNLDACAVLIGSLANIEETNERNETPLHVAAEGGSLQVAKHLLDCGAHPNPLDAWAETPLMFAYQKGQWDLVDLLTPYCKDMMRTNHIGETGLHFMTRFEPNPARARSSLEAFYRCIKQGVSLYLRDIAGITPAHWILGSQSACYLRSLLNRDYRFLRPQEIVPWPEMCFVHGTHKLMAISKNLRLIRPFLSKHELHQLCGVADSGNHSLLCRAAGRGLVEAIENFLALGVDMIEHECNDHGTPLTAAVSNCQIEAVKCLVRNGATVSYDLCPPADSRGRMASPGIVMRQWLFVGRYVEQKRISNGTTEAADRIESWAGVCSVEVALKWGWKRRWGESTREYACRLQGIIKDLRGKVVKCVGETDSRAVGSEDGSDFDSADE